MNISWFEIIAQIINFFIILFLLQKLLYKPILNVMAARQERIQKSQIEADEKMDEAEKLMNQYNKKMADIQKEKQDIMDGARKEAEEKKEALLENYRQEAESKRNAYLKEIDDEKERFIANLRKKLGSGAVAIASHIVSTVSSKDLDKEVFQRFVANLKDLGQEIPNMESLDEETIDIYSARELSDDEKKTVEDVLNKQIQHIQQIEYRIDPDLIVGYEMHLQTYTVHASVKNYLDEIEQDIIKNLEIN